MDMPGWFLWAAALSPWADRTLWNLQPQVYPLSLVRSGRISPGWVKIYSKQVWSPDVTPGQQVVETMCRHLEAPRDQKANMKTVSQYICEKQGGARTAVAAIEEALGRS